MLRLLNPSTFTKNLKPVTSMIITTKIGDFHEDGLFSESIFGALGSNDRRIVFSYVDLYGYVIHPSIYRILMQLDRKIEKFISTEKSFILDKDGHLEISSKGVTGMKEFIKLFPKIKWRGETDLRNKLIKTVKRETKNGTIFIDKIIIIPPDLRPAVKGEDGNWMIDTLNDIYISVMRKAFQLRSSGSGPLFDLLNYAMHQSVMEHDNFIRSKIGKKHGIIREQMLGKRIDFSGRAVITPDPNLKINQVGVPLRLAIGLFEPFIMHRLLYSGRVDRDVLANGIKEYTGMDLSVESVKRVMKGIKEGDKIPDNLYELFFEQTEVSMIDRIVVVKRDPVLHTQSYLAYYPVLHRGDTMLMSTTQVGVHNADFDGDCTILSIYYEKNNKLNKIHISEFLENENFEFVSKQEKSNGIVVSKYKPIDELFIKSIDPETGFIENKKISQYSIHENIDMYKIKDKKNRFEEFWSSYDHSLTIYDKMDDKIKKMSPKEVLANPDNKFLIREII